MTKGVSSGNGNYCPLTESCGATPNANYIGMCYGSTHGGGLLMSWRLYGGIYRWIIIDPSDNSIWGPCTGTVYF